MIQFADMSEFHKGSRFFMFRPFRSIRIFVVVTLGVICGTVIWSLTAQAEDVIKVAALIRPNETISLLKTTVSGEVLKKNYTHNEYTALGTLLLQIDVSSDILELDNSKKLMERTVNTIVTYNTLINTIKQNRNTADPQNEEARLRSEAYLNEKRQLSEKIKTSEIALQREISKPTAVVIRNDREDIEREIARAELQLDIWENNQLITAMDNVKTALQNRENLERRIADLERNIKTAELYAPISDRVNEIRKLNTGDRVLTGEEIMSIIPENDRELKAELYVNPAYVARTKVGQSVSLRFPGLPPSKFGKLDAVISLIPADYTIGQDMNPIFILEARIPEPWLTASNGGRLYLRAGIGAEAHIIIDHDTVMSMILKKLDFIN